MKIVIVESPTKARTISKFLGPDFKVLSSYGHIRDLPKTKFGVDIEQNFEPKYIIVPKARKTIQLLKKELEKTDLCYLSTDPDREGEAIAWHLSQVLQLGKFQIPNEIQPAYRRAGRTTKSELESKFQTNSKAYARIVFHEITKSAIEEALKNPRDINMNLVDAQQARRILDRIVGYKLSPFLWKKVARRLSAGRVQSVAVRLIVEREREIENFIPQEYWNIEALLQKTQISGYSQNGHKSQNHSFKPKTEFNALLVKKDNKIIPKLGIKNKKETEEILKDLEGAKYKIINIEKKENKRNPLPPFMTSFLQQETWQRFKWPAKLTMQIAQQLYEKGLTTYHRTDSLNVSDLILATAKKFIIKNYGQSYYQFRKFKTKSKVAQEAHEAIRPTYLEKTPEKLRIKLDERQLRLYDLIWRRFISSQMAQASFDSTIVEIEAKVQVSAKQAQKSKVKRYTFKTTGQVLKFDGFLKVYPIKYEEAELPSLKINEILELIKLIPSQHFTQPPPRYNEATLIKELEKNGIGRPSTYAPILSTIQERNYIEKDEQKRIRPTEIGIVVNDLLVNHFSEIVDVKFTAKIEEDLDKIANNEKKWVSVIKEFYNPFEKNLQQKYQEVSKEDIMKEPTEKICQKCGAFLLLRFGKYGRFYACSKFPKCKYTESFEKNLLEIKCPKCEKGELIIKKTKKRKIFYGCNQFPNCDFALWDKPTGEICQKCHSLLIENKKKQIRCQNKECDFIIKNS